MKKIIGAGYLKVHPSGMMATIVMSNGRETQVLATKRQALEIGGAHVGLGISDFEWLAIRQQIHASPLIDKNKELEEFSNTMQNNLKDLEKKIRSIFKDWKKQDGEGEEWKSN